jgi:hypothetical protein
MTAPSSLMQFVLSGAPELDYATQATIAAVLIATLFVFYLTGRYGVLGLVCILRAAVRKVLLSVLSACF